MLKKEESLRHHMRDPQKRLELVATFLMSIAIACSAYCAYEATRWSGVQAINFASASTARIESGKATSTAWQQQSYDASSLMSLTDSYIKGDTETVDILSQRFIRREFRPYVEEWVALDPLNNPDAPPTPFDLPDFINIEFERAKALEDEAATKFQEAQDANQTGDNYILATVFFALVLFFAGISTKIDYLLLQRIVLVFASAGLAMGIVRMLSLPYY